MFVVAPTYIIRKYDLPLCINVLDKALLPSAFWTSQLRASFVFLKCKSIFSHSLTFINAVRAVCSYCSFAEISVPKLQTANTARCKQCGLLKFLIFASFDFPNYLFGGKVVQHIHHSPFRHSDFFSSLDSLGCGEQ